MTARNMQFIDLQKQREHLGVKLDEAILGVVNRGQYIMGPEVKLLEEKLCDFSGARHAISCANGTDALVLALMAHDIGPGDAVIVPSFTFIASAEAICLVGATPVFCDVDERTFNICPRSLQEAVSLVKGSDLTLKAIIAVDMFGLPADYEKIEALAKEERAILICDSAQGFGGSIKGKRTGTFGDVTTTSFFPAKPLGCFGDGGALLTNNEELADRLRSLRVHGKGSNKYDNVRIGQNSRLDTLQAAILLEKLAIFSEEIEARNKIAQRYSNALSETLITPFIPQDYISVWAQYTVICENREKVVECCREKGVPTAVYYPIPMHQQQAYKHYPSVNDGYLAVSERLSNQVISLPMHPYLEEVDQQYIIDTLIS